MCISIVVFFMFCIYLHVYNAQDLKFLLVDLSSEFLNLPRFYFWLFACLQSWKSSSLWALVRKNEKALSKKKISVTSVYLHFETLILLTGCSWNEGNCLKTQMPIIVRKSILFFRKHVLSIWGPNSWLS